VYCRGLLRPVGCPHPGLILFAGLLPHWRRRNRGRTARRPSGAGPVAPRRRAHGASVAQSRGRCRTPARGASARSRYRVLPHRQPTRATSTAGESYAPLKSIGSREAGVVDATVGRRPEDDLAPPELHRGAVDMLAAEKRRGRRDGRGGLDLLALEEMRDGVADPGCERGSDLHLVADLVGVVEFLLHE